MKPALAEAYRVRNDTPMWLRRLSCWLRRFHIPCYDRIEPDKSGALRVMAYGPCQWCDHVTLFEERFDLLAKAGVDRVITSTAPAPHPEVVNGNERQ